MTAQELTDEQRGGTACVVCGLDYITDAAPVRHVPVGVVDGGQVFACASHGMRQDEGMDLVTFLRARLDEDEAAAKAWLPFGNPDDAQREHIARHDPARVLAEVEAKRRIVEKCDNVLDGSAWDLAQATLRLLALPYADHPDYLPEWRP